MDEGRLIVVGPAVLVATVVGRGLAFVRVVEGGGNVSLYWASKTLKTEGPPQIWDPSPAQGVLQSVWSSVYSAGT